MVATVIVGILMSQNFQFMKVNIVSINPKAVANLFISTKIICATPMTSHIATYKIY